MRQKTAFIIATVLMLIAFVLATQVYKGEKAEAPAGRTGANLVRMHSPSLGKTDAPVVIVEFFDPACETCAAFYPLVKKMLAENPQRIRLVLRYAPFHKGSDKVVALLEAARKQDKYWQALEALLASQPEWVQNHAAQIDLVWKPLGRAGLNLDQLRADAGSAEIAAVIVQDLDDAKALKVTMTPEFFVNGKPLPSFGLRQLQALVDEALAASRR